MVLLGLHLGYPYGGKPITNQSGVETQLFTRNIENLDTISIVHMEAYIYPGQTIKLDLTFQNTDLVTQSSLRSWTKMQGSHASHSTNNVHSN